MTQEYMNKPNEPRLAVAPEKGADSAAQIADALYLVAAVTKNEVPMASGAAITDEDINTINRVAALFRDKLVLLADEKTALDLAVGRISKAIAPATIQSLKDTDPERKRWYFLWWTYEANLLSYQLVFWTVIFVAIALAGDFMMRYFGEPLEQAEGIQNAVGIFLQNLTPFTYGAIGASVSLLRSLHAYIHARSFDRRRRPEYVNRILLGSVSGGAMVLLVDQIVNDSGEAIHFSAAALGFLAGYNTDFLFSAIERITAAILPKAGLDSVRRKAGQDTPPAAAPVVTDLLNRLGNAKTDQERQTIRALLDRVVTAAR